MNDAMRRFMAKTNPMTLKSVIDKARYGVLPDQLTIGEVAELWSKDGLTKNSEEWSNVVEFMSGLVKSGLLACGDKDIALGKVNKKQMQYEAIAIAFGVNPSGDRYYKPCDARITRSDLKQFLNENDGWPLVGDFLIARWWLSNEDIADGSDANPAHAGSKAKQEKDRDALERVKSDPALLGCSKAEIKKELTEYSIEFKKGFEDWWRTQNIFEKDRGGRPRKQ